MLLVSSDGATRSSHSLSVISAAIGDNASRCHGYATRYTRRSRHLVSLIHCIGHVACVEYIEVLVEIPVIAMLVRDVLVELAVREAIALAQRTLVALRHIGLHIGLAAEVKLVLVARVVHLKRMEILVLERGAGGIGQLARVVAAATELIIDA